MSELIKGSAIVINGVHINVDTAMGWYVGMDSLPQEEIASQFMSGVDPKIAAIVKKGDILVGGRNFGYGKAHGAFFTALGFLGIRCIVAESFSTQIIQSGLGSYGGPGQDLFFVECPAILEKVTTGDVLEVDAPRAIVQNKTKNITVQGKPFPEFLVNVMLAGGQMGFVRQKFAKI
jgi:3-isopropylmalate/(R)-2-methylmalate dehydratase small subunit